MSQIPHDPSNLLSLVKPSRDFDLWEPFIQAVLEVTIQGHAMMRLDAKPRRDWREDTFTVNLARYIRPIAKQHPLCLQVHEQVPVYTEAMLDGQQDTREATWIDIKLWGDWSNYDEVYFAWEAKLVADKEISKGKRDSALVEKYRKLGNQYVTNGILRFIDLQYARKLNRAGMLGYILTGDAETIAKDINRCMERLKNNPLSQDHHLQRTVSVNGHCEAYYSRHLRTDNSEILLYHLLLAFEFPS